jgi:uncharacterized caspase-like protein
MQNLPYNPEKTYALLLGVGKRTDDAEAMAITAQDAQKMAEELEKRCAIPSANIKTLTNEASHKVGFITALDALIETTQTNPADMVWIYFSGHGGIHDNQYYLICHDTNANDIPRTALLGTDFVQKLQAIQSDKMLILLDCCHAGGITTQGIQRVDIPFEAGDFLKSKPNRVVLTASHASQVSYLSKPVSIFTYVLVEGLAGLGLEGEDKAVTIFDLAMYVRERVYPLSELKQQPQLNVLEDSHTTNFTVAYYPNGKPSELPFDKAFRLLGANDKEINTKILPSKDTNYRTKFEWLMNSEAKIEGNKNIVVQNVSDSVITINVNGENIEIKKELFEIKELLKQQNAQTLIKELLKQQNAQTFQIADKIYNIENINEANFKSIIGQSSDYNKGIILHSIREYFVNKFFSKVSSDYNKGIILHCIPRKMQLHNLHRCIIRVAFDKEKILKDLPSFVGDVVIKKDVRVGEKMEVVFVENDYFSINQVNNPIQIIDSYSLTEWNFYVKPLKLGRFPLTFKISVILSNGSKEVVLTESIEVITETVPESMVFEVSNLESKEDKSQNASNFEIDFNAIDDAYNNSDFATILDILGEYFKKKPNPQYGILRDTIENYLNQGLMPPIANRQGLKVLINKLKKELGVSNL